MMGSGLFIEGKNTKDINRQHIQPVKCVIFPPTWQFKYVNAYWHVFQVYYILLWQSGDSEARALCQQPEGRWFESPECPE